MTRAEFDTALEWAADEGWNPGLDDGDPYHGADPDGLIGASLNSRPITCISAVRYGADFGFIGLYLCHPDFRGQGYGLQTWGTGMEHLGGRTIGLYAVLDQQANYQKSGFQPAHSVVRFGGAVACDRPTDARLRPIDRELASSVLDYDAPFFPAPRQNFLHPWITPQETRSGFALVEDGDLTGYGIVRRSRDGHKIGPLFADRESDADLLFRALASAGGPIILDLPVPNGLAVAMAERYGLTPVFETAQMYRGETPDLPLARIYGITTMELG